MVYYESNRTGSSQSVKSISWLKRSQDEWLLLSGSPIYCLQMINCQLCLLEQLLKGPWTAFCMYHHSNVSIRTHPHQPVSRCTASHWSLRWKRYCPSKESEHSSSPPPARTKFEHGDSGTGSVASAGAPPTSTGSGKNRWEVTGREEHRGNAGQVTTTRSPSEFDICIRNTKRQNLTFVSNLVI